MIPDAERLVLALVARLERALGDGDIGAALACFRPTGATYGAAPTEHAHGTRELRRWLLGLVEDDVRPRWAVEGVQTRAQTDEIWFVARAVLRTSDDPDGRPFRMTGVLRGRRGWYRFELFNGFEPLLRGDLHAV